MKLFIFILSLNLLFASHPLYVNGYILDEQDNPIENVEITIESLDIGTTSDINGFFNLSIPNNGEYMLSFSHIGYENYNHRIDTNKKKSIDVKLKYMPIEKDLLVITSNRKKTLIKDSPIITHLIDNEDITSSGSSTLEEIMKFAMPNIQSVHDNHSNDKVKIQGLDNKYVTFLVDGNKISGEFAGNTDMSLFSLNNIERIEVIRGGLSTIYGSGAMGGVLNIITKNNDKSLRVNLNSFYDNPKIFSNSCNIAIQYKIINYSININHSRSDGYDLTDENYLGKTESVNKTLEEYSSLLLNHKLTLKFTDKILLNINYSDYKKDINKYYYNSSPHGYQGLNLQTQLPVFENNTLSANLKTFFDDNKKIEFYYQNESHSKSYYFPYYNSSPNGDENGETFLWSTPKTSRFSIIYMSDLNNHSISFGLDNVYESYKSMNIYGANDSLEVSSIFGNNDTKSINQNSIFILDDFTLGNLEINLGLRANYSSKYKTNFSPSISMKKVIRNYNYRFNFSHSYRNPSIKELYYSFEDHPGGFPVIGNENLNPSTSDYLSLSIESRKLINNSIEFYYNHVYNMIANKFEYHESFNETVYIYDNYKEINLFGVNFNLSFNPSDKTTLKSAYSYTGANSEYKDALDGISKHSINFRFKYDLMDNLHFTLSTTYASSKTVDSSLEDFDNNRTEIILPSHSISNLTIIKSFQKNIYIKMGIKNIFNYIDVNEEALDFLASYEPGRRYFISINLNFEK